MVYLKLLFTRNLHTHTCMQNPHDKNFRRTFRINGASTRTTLFIGMVTSSVFAPYSPYCFRNVTLFHTAFFGRRTTWSVKH